MDILFTASLLMERIWTDVVILEDDENAVWIVRLVVPPDI